MGYNEVTHSRTAEHTQRAGLTINLGCFKKAACWFAFQNDLALEARSV